MKNTHEKPIIGITVGDPNGVGPEVVLLALRHRTVMRNCRPMLVGPAGVFQYYSRKLGIPLRAVPIVEIPSFPKFSVKTGTVTREAGGIASRAIEAAVDLARSGFIDAIVTAPVSKQALHRAGSRFPGQTEMLQRLCRTRRVAMMLVSPTMKVGLVTIHTPIRNVARRITRDLILERVHVIHEALVQDWAIRSPRLAVLGLNPHAGEGGDIGTEDRTIIAPTVKHLRKGGMKIEGPFPADSFFGRYTAGHYDAVIAMYHDQGLIPLKMSSFNNGVNVTAGLPIVRTSPDHGTAFDIAGRGIANPGSMVAAIALAARIANNRRRRWS